MGAIGPRVVEIDAAEDIPPLLAAAELGRHLPVLVVVGGASGLNAYTIAIARRIIEQVAMPAALDCGAAIVDGGTDSGVMRLLGLAHHSARASAPLVGVAVRRLVRVRDLPGTGTGEDSADAEGHHTHLVLVPGEKWGDESPWLSAVAGHMSSGRTSVTLVVNGGSITLSDVQHSLSAGRAVVAAAGTGRAADLLATAARGGASDSTDLAEQVRSAVASGLVSALDATLDADLCRAELSRLLRSR